MGIDNSSHANTSANQPDALIQKAAGDMHLGMLNSQAFSDDIRALYSRDQGNQVRLNADLRTLNDELVANKTLPNALIVGEDSKGDIIYDLPTANKIGVVAINQKEVDNGPDKEMEAKYGVTVQKQAIWNGVFSPEEIAARAKSDSTNPQYSQTPETGYGNSPSETGYGNPPAETGYAQPESPYAYGPAEPPPPYGYASEPRNGYEPETYDMPPLDYNRPRAEIVLNPVGIVRDVAKLFGK